MKKKPGILFIVIAIVVILLGVVGFKVVNAYKEKIDETTITNVDLTKVSDGTYTGSYDATMVSAEVKVTIQDHKITDIVLVKHNNGKGAPAEVIPDKVKSAQSLDVDIVSGATSSSKVILKAIENALNSGIK